MSVTTRIQELNDRLATNLVSKGVSAEGTETTTELINKVNDIETGGTSVINPEWTDWRYFSYDNNRNDLVAKLKYSDTANGTNFSYMFYSCSKLTTISLLMKKVSHIQFVKLKQAIQDIIQKKLKLTKNL